MPNLSVKKRRFSLPAIMHLNHLTLKGVLIIMGILALFQLYISNNFVSEGEKIKNIQTKAQELESENLRLQNQIQQRSSLSFIEKQASERGFSKIQKVEYVNPEVSVASR
jgi:hypothetical protein